MSVLSTRKIKCNVVFFAFMLKLYTESFSYKKISPRFPAAAAAVKVTKVFRCKPLKKAKPLLQHTEQK